MNNVKPKKIIIATRNNHKLYEIIQVMADLNLEILSLKDFPGLPDIKETGKTFNENALLKANAVYHQTGFWSIADDSGLEVSALNGQPGIYSARYAGPNKDIKENNEKLLRNMIKIPFEKRGAQFYCAAAIAGPEITETVEGIVKGKISTEPRGTNGFGYDPLFIPEGFDQTLGELDEEIKNNISHRAIAFKKMSKLLKTYISKS